MKKLDQETLDMLRCMFPDSNILADVEIVPDDEPEEIIEGLSPGNWTWHHDPFLKLAPHHWFVRDGNKKIIYSSNNQADAKLIAGSKALLETLVTWMVPSSPTNVKKASWLVKLDWIHYVRSENSGNPGWIRLLDAMRFMGIEFPERV